MMCQNTYRETFVGNRQGLCVSLLLVIATIAVYWKVQQFDFVFYDDPLYVTENRYVQSGLTLDSIIWSFTNATKITNYWSPLTWMSFIFEFQIYGMNPGGYHITNVFIHLTNTILLFYILNRMTGALWRSAFVAALFALHPLHVESVAWVTERKDVLSTLFWVLTILCYIRYIERPGVSRYGIVILFFLMGLMAKPMLVTLPFVLLLLDYWPLRRYQSGQPADMVVSKLQLSKIRRLILEKTPLFLMTGIISILTFVTQHEGGAVKSMVSFPLTVRVANALVSYVTYIGKMICPQSLSVLYPHPGALPLWQSVGAFIFIASIFYLVITEIKTRPYLFVGWLWYMGTLAPVNGLVVIGPHAAADRYTYVPLIGLFIIIAWGVPELFTKWRLKVAGVSAMAAFVLFVLSILSWVQVQYWQNSITLFERTLDVTENNYTIHNNLGIALARAGQGSEAYRQYLEALRIKPDFVEAHLNLGNLLMGMNRVDEAVDHFQKALKIYPDFHGIHYCLGRAQSKLGNPTAAIRHYSIALQLAPNDADAHNNIGLLQAGQGRIRAAVSHFEKALHVDPGHTNAYNNLNNLAMAYALRGDYNKAQPLFKRAIVLAPDRWDAYYYIAGTYARQNHVNEAVKWLEKSVQKGFRDRSLMMADKNLEGIKHTEYYKELIKDH